MTGSPPPETTAPLVSITWPERGGGRPDLLAGEDLLRRGGERVVRGVQQRVAGDDEGGAARRHDGDDDGGRGGEDEAGAKGHVSRRT